MTKQEVSTVRVLHDFLTARQQKFRALDAAKLLSWEQECEFAKQQILRNPFTLKVAMDNQLSLQEAIFNVASIGLTLNPASQYAYLVPRDGKIVLDISYRGLVKLATDAGMVKAVKAELVYAEDEFAYNGPFESPHFRADVFSDDRGDLRGAFCVAKLVDGSVIVDHMSAKEIWKSRDSSAAYKAVESGKAKTSPWHEWPGPMALKTMVKRASKMWPTAPGAERLHKAIEVINQHEGIELEPFSVDQKEEFDRLISEGNAIGLLEFNYRVGKRVWDNLKGAIESGQKVATKDKIAEMHKQAHAQLDEIADQILELAQTNDISGASEIWEELTEFEQTMVAKRTDVIWFHNERPN